MISVVIPVYNGEQTLPTCLEALLAQQCLGQRLEIIVVDDGSCDRSAHIAATYPVRLLRQQHRGPAAARNLGIRAARGELVLFTDADCEPTSHWAAALASAFTDPLVAGAKGSYLTRQLAPVPRFVQLEYEDRYHRMAGNASIDFVDTYAAAYRRDVLLDNGGFDETFPTSSVEDQELSFRLARKGYKLVFVPEAQVYHTHDTTMAQYFWRKYSIGYWKALLTRWHPERLLSDSHTPQVLKLQMLLAATTSLSALVGSLGVLAWRQLLWSWLGFVVSVLLFGVTSVPFLERIRRQAPDLLAWAPILLLVRASALGLGFAIGKVRFAFAAPGRTPALSTTQRLLKRTMDILGACLGLLLTAPLMVCIALLIKLNSAGPIIYRQARIGENGRVFYILKFRSMVADAESRLENLVDLDALPEPVFKLENDPRITRVGRWLRRFSLDELPQFFNVLRGEMSLVGPRPEEVWVVERYNDWHRQRFAVKPGMTGPMQINGRADLTLDQRVQLELDYIRHYSLWQDLRILFRTMPAVIRGDGAR